MDQRQRVVQIVLQLLDELPALLGAGSEAVEEELRVLVARAIAGPGPEPLRALVSYVRATPAVADRFDELAGGNWRGRTSSPAGPAQYARVEIFYATDRAPTGVRDPGRWFGGERGLDPQAALHLGRCVVTIPDSHAAGEVESPGLLDLFHRDDPSRYVLLASLEPLTRAAFDQAAGERYGDSPRALLFVHGYNVSFAEAMKRAGQLTHDMKFPAVGPTFCFSWPSRGEFFSYGADADSTTWAADHLAAFLTHLRTETPSLRLHIVAHSMGNRVVTEALKQLYLAKEAPMENVSDLALAAPDVDRQVFEARAPSLRESAQRVTLYASSSDRALWLSTLFHQGLRAGDAGDRMLVLDGIDSIDATRADSSLLSLGHSYFAGKPTVLEDLKRLFLEGLSPAQRGLKRHAQSLHWVM